MQYLEPISIQAEKVNCKWKKEKKEKNASQQ